MKIIFQLKYRNDEINMAHLFASCYTIDEERPAMFSKILKEINIIMIDKGRYLKRTKHLSNVIEYFDWIFR